MSGVHQWHFTKRLKNVNVRYQRLVHRAKRFDIIYSSNSVGYDTVLRCEPVRQFILSGDIQRVSESVTCLGCLK